MKEFKDKKRNKRRSKLLLAIMAIALIFLIKGTVSTYSKQRDSQSEVVRVLKEKQELEKRYTVMSEQSESLKSPIGIESEIRGKFDVTKAGEGVIVIVEQDIPRVEEDKRGTFRKMWDSVRGVFSSDES